MSARIPRCRPVQPMPLRSLRFADGGIQSWPNSAFSTRTPCSVRRFNNDDLPALAYPAIATDGRNTTAVGTFTGRLHRGDFRCGHACADLGGGPVRSWFRCHLRLPTPAPAPPTWPPACRDMESPQPRRRGSRYSSWLHLGLPAALGVLGEDIQDQRGPVNHLYLHDVLKTASLRTVPVQCPPRQCPRLWQRQCP